MTVPDPHEHAEESAASSAGEQNAGAGAADAAEGPPGADATSESGAGGDGTGTDEDATAAPDCSQCPEFLNSVARLKAEFANFRRRAAEQQAQAAERGAADLATRLLEVLDAAEAGAAHDADLVGPLHGALVDALTEGGLEVISPAGEPFDPMYHEAVMHETGDTPGAPIVTDVLRTGYAWSGRVLRPAVVGVRG